MTNDSTNSNMIANNIKLNNIREVEIDAIEPTLYSDSPKLLKLKICYGLSNSNLSTASTNNQFQINNDEKSIKFYDNRSSVVPEKTFVNSLPIKKRTLNNKRNVNKKKRSKYSDDDYIYYYNGKLELPEYPPMHPVEKTLTGEALLYIKREKFLLFGGKIIRLPKMTCNRQLKGLILVFLSRYM